MPGPARTPRRSWRKSIACSRRSAGASLTTGAITLLPDWRMCGGALAVSGGAAFLGVAGAVRAAVNLPPAEAMRPEPPAEFKPSMLERAGLAQFVGPAFRMALRNLERRPWQAF